MLCLHEGNCGNVLKGRHVVELALLSDQLQRGCNVCGRALKLSLCVGKQRQGLASILAMACQKCGCTTSMPTSKTHYPGGAKRGQPAYDVNIKFALAVMVSGIASTPADKFLATLNVLTMHHKSQKKRETYWSCCLIFGKEHLYCCLFRSVSLEFAGYQCHANLAGR